MHGSRFFLLTCALCAIFGGCGHLPGVAARRVPLISPARAPDLALRLGDLPSGFVVVSDQAPTNPQLAQLLQQPQAADVLQATGRQAGVMRMFAYTSPEPTTISGVTQIHIEFDVFATSSGALTWLRQRGTMLTAVGSLMTVPAPGQAHIVRAQSYHAGDIVATTAVIAYSEQNVYVEITTTTLSQGVSIAEPERFADIIDARLVPPTP